MNTLKIRDLPHAEMGVHYEYGANGSRAHRCVRGLIFPSDGASTKSAGVGSIGSSSPIVVGGTAPEGAEEALLAENIAKALQMGKGERLSVGHVIDSLQKVIIGRQERAEEYYFSPHLYLQQRTTSQLQRGLKERKNLLGNVVLGRQLSPVGVMTAPPNRRHIR